MKPVKIASITLKPSPTIEELRKELNPAQESSRPELTQLESNLETVDEVMGQEPGTIQEIPKSDINIVSEELSLAYDLSSIIQRVEALDKTGERIKALGKLKGALELLS